MLFTLTQLFQIRELRDKELDLQRQMNLLKAKELEGVLLHTRKVTVCDRYPDTPIRLGREAKKSGQDTVMRGDAGRELHVIAWISTDDETHLVLWDADFFQDVISILAPLCPVVKHISVDLHCHWMQLHPLTLMPKPKLMPMRSVITVCIKTLYSSKTLHDTLLEVSKLFLNAASLDLLIESLISPSDQALFHEVNSSSSVRELKLRCEGRCSDDVPTDSLLIDICTSCPNIVSLVLSGFGRSLSIKSGKEITSCKMPHLTNIHLEPFETDDCYKFVTLIHVLHVFYVINPRLRYVEAKKVQLGDAELTSVTWYRTFSGSELQLEGAPTAVPMADLMHLVSTELEGVTVLTLDRCKVDIPQSTSHPPQCTGKESSLRELKFLNVECPLSQSDIHKLSEMYPNVKVTVEHDSKASHEDSKQGTSMHFELKRRTSPSSSPTSSFSLPPTSSICEFIKIIHVCMFALMNLFTYIGVYCSGLPHVFPFYLRSTVLCLKVPIQRLSQIWQITYH
ncbi:uncharacterized protein LOC115920969 [Strongylocentrotus purpuratus]|uniref:Uncharacterized protein n=1 Tax=Strongylocentrotus purpuratus TaxID=7668 RepID=A0A7M7SV81_STRPU|nr:uncharacterized protein LOC115920969 [Strongylocentrotus purpuratus]